MTALISLDRVSIQMGSTRLFQELKLTVPERARIGIVGPNGCGKSTLLKILAQQVTPDAGRVLLESSRNVCYIPQVVGFNLTDTVLEAVIKKAEREVVSHEREVRASKALSRAGFSDFTQRVSELSGGWRKRLSIAAALSEDPELLLLDEPTNHLDFEGMAWLEGLLTAASFAWVLVSHDRYFLEQTVHKIVEISPVYPTGYHEYDGSYLEFKSKREAFLEQQAKRTSSLANKTRRELEWAARSPSARTGKAAYRMKEALRLKQALAQANSRQETSQSITSFQSAGRNTRELVQLIKCSFSYGEKQIFDQLTYTLLNGMCLGLLGKNGDGKSTLLKVFGSELTSGTGKVKHAPGLKVVYFDQLREALGEHSTLGAMLGDGSDHVVYNEKSFHVVGWGKRFGFQAEDHEKPLSALSGGEQARALLSILVRQEADLLLLDEPTNDLDISMLEALEMMILEFPGAVVLITHDRFMLEEVCTHFLGFTNKNVMEFASYTQWNEQCLQEHLTQPSTQERKEKRKNSATKLTYNDQREYTKIESKIEKAEAQLALIEEEVADPNAHIDPEKSRDLSAKHEEAKKEVERLYARWEELDALKREFDRQKGSA